MVRHQQSIPFVVVCSLLGLVSFVLLACSPAMFARTEPTATPTKTPKTAEVAVVATNTPLAPTDTPLPPPTDTPLPEQPTETPVPTDTPLPNNTPAGVTNTPTNTSVATNTATTGASQTAQPSGTASGTVSGGATASPTKQAPLPPNTGTGGDFGGSSTLAALFVVIIGLGVSGFAATRVTRKR